MQEDPATASTRKQAIGGTETLRRNENQKKKTVTVDCTNWRNSLLSVKTVERNCEMFKWNYLCVTTCMTRGSVLCAWIT